MTKTVEAPQNQQNFSRQVAFWKPYLKDGKALGAVALFNYSEKNNRVFLEIRPQLLSETNQNSFDKENSIRAMLGLPDIGEFLAVFRGRKQGLGSPDDKNGWKGLFHKNENGSTSISMVATDRGYSLSVGSKRGNDQAVRLGLNLTIAEGEVLHDYLSEMLKEMF